MLVFLIAVIAAEIAESNFVRFSFALKPFWSFFTEGRWEVLEELTYNQINYRLVSPSDFF